MDGGRMSEMDERMMVSGSLRLRRSARATLQMVLAVLGAGFAWFAYIDAPITDGAMRLFALAVLAGLGTLIAALLAIESKTEKRARRLQRLALWLFVASTALMLTAATVTLNLKGTGSDESYTQTSLITPA
jgi:drug/metabolite transporter (DMT)-like permease